MAPASPATRRASWIPRRYPAERFVVPPARTSRTAARIAALSTTGPAGTTTCTSSSKATTPRRSVGSSRSATARRAASRRSPSIEPLRSRTTCTVAGGRGVEPDSAGAVSSSITVTSSSYSTATRSRSRCVLISIAAPRSSAAWSRVAGRPRDLTPSIERARRPAMASKLPTRVPRRVRRGRGPRPVRRRQRGGERESRPSRPRVGRVGRGGLTAVSGAASGERLPALHAISSRTSKTSRSGAAAHGRSPARVGCRGRTLMPRRWPAAARLVRDAGRSRPARRLLAPRREPPRRARHSRRPQPPARLHRRRASLQRFRGCRRRLQRQCPRPCAEVASAARVTQDNPVLLTLLVPAALIAVGALAVLGWWLDRQDRANA